MQKIFLICFIQFVFVYANALCVTSDKAQLRSKPGSKNPVTWTVAKYTPLIEVRKAGGWYEVEDMDGETHWIYSKSVSRKMVCAAVKVNVAILRKQPGSQGEVADIRQVDRYTPFKRIDVQGEWYQVQASWGDTYWIHESVVWRPIRISRIKF